MLSEYLLTLFLEAVNMPAAACAGILSLYENGLLRLMLSAVTVCATLFCIGLRRPFFVQSGLSLAREPLTVIAGGLMGYGLGLALLLIFFVSIVGFPVALVILFTLAALIFLGQAALSVMFGELFADKFYIGLGNYQSAFIGALIIEATNYLPYIGWLFRFIVWPVLAVGAISTGFSNGFIRKVFYQQTVRGQKPKPSARDIVKKYIDGLR